jgi:sugar phosphate isomerase/epimerase
MQNSRRKFIKISGATAAGLAFGSIAGFPALFQDEEAAKRIKKFGIQLYTLRDVLPNDPKGILKSLAEFGYKHLESYEHSKLGMYWGMTNTEFKRYVDGLGMKTVASHCDIDKDFEKKAAEAAAIGMKYLIAAWEGPGLSIDDYKRYAEKLNQRGATCKKHGLRFAFHNHSFSFLKVNSEFPQDVMMQNTDASLVDFEIDLYWAVAAGQDPQDWLKKYPNRFRLCHVKDRVKGTTKLEDTCDLGKGSIDYGPILRTAKEQGMEFYITEQEHYPGSTPVDSARSNAEYMKKLRI